MILDYLGMGEDRDQLEYIIWIAVVLIALFLTLGAIFA